VRVKLTWKPQWTPKITNPTTCNPYDSNAFGPPAVLGVALYGPKFEATGIVDPDTTVPLDDCEPGFLQAVVASEMTAVYLDAGGRPPWTLTISERTLPVGDSDDETSAWVKIKDVKSLNAPDGTRSR
jgi:hypothetical protein